MEGRYVFINVSHIGPRSFETITLPLQFQEAAVSPASALQTFHAHTLARIARTHRRDALTHSTHRQCPDFSNTPKPSRPTRDKSRAGARHPPPGLGSFSTYSVRG